MSIENRTLTAIPWYETSDLLATPPELTYDRAADWNAWQDTGCRVMSLDQVMLPPAGGFETIIGGLKFYGQSEEMTTGAASTLFSISNANNYDASYTLLDRIIECEVWTSAAANAIPQGAAYDPDVQADAITDWLWYTGDGAPDGGPPASGDYWRPWPAVNIWIYVNQTGTEIRCYNSVPAASRWVVLMGTITQEIA